MAFPLSMVWRQAAQQVWSQRHKPEYWLLFSNLSSRLLGFVVSLLLSRLAGVQALGLYSGLMITCASCTTPFSAALGNNATIFASRHQGRVTRLSLLHSQFLVLLLCILISCSVCWMMLRSTGLTGHQAISDATFFKVMVGMVVGQMLTQTVLGLCHGAMLSKQGAVLVSIVTLLALPMVYPVLKDFGAEGLLWLAVCVAVLPGLGIGIWFVKTPTVGSAEPLQSPCGLRTEPWVQFRAALPNILATVINSATNWLTCIYLSERFHSHAGLGLIAIGLQWMMLMQLPLSSWGGRIMGSLASAHAQSGLVLRAELTHQLKRSVRVSLVMAVGVLLISPWLAGVYRVDAYQLVGLFAINAMASVVSSLNFVYERVFFCVGAQRVWLWVSVLAYLVQLIFTAIFVPYSVLAIAAGNLLALAVVSVSVVFYFKAMWARQAN